MRTDLFDYELPPELIAKRPPERRDAGRLLVVEADRVGHALVRDWPALVEPGSLVVLNETRVLRARLLGRRAGSGGKVELLLLGRLAGAAPERWRALYRSSRPLAPGAEIEVGALTLRVVERDAEGILTVDIACSESVEAALQRYGRVPIPPYLGRSDDEIDQERYESIFARHYGSVAAPTASLHLTAELLERLTERGIRIGRLVLHIGLATFRPVSSEELDDHVMHAEYVELDEQLAEQVALTRRQGGRVVAVGTSVVRALESAQDPERSGCIRPCRGETRLFIRPGYGFSTVDGLLTNFHQPKSTLLALVSAFAGRKRLLSAYAEAVAGRYRFLSYGDAMWIPERLR